MINHFQLSFILLFLACTLLGNTYGQGATKNGRGSNQLDPVQPGSPEFNARNRTRCSREFREFDGTCTNNVFRTAGSASTAHYSYFARRSSTDADFNTLPSPRQISNVLCSQTDNIYNSRRLSEFVTFFAQFLDHTIVATRPNPNEPRHIVIPKDDSIYQNYSGILRFNRNERALSFSNRGRRRSGKIELPINVLSAAIDLASVYGASVERALALRERRDGLMKTSTGNMLPLNEQGLFNAPTSSSVFFVAGDHRSNEHPMLTSLHILFLREHNRLATELKDIYPSWDDDRLYQTARKINIAQFQKIVYTEFIPAMTGRRIRYKRFRAKALPAVSVLFSTAAFRVGHTMVGNDIPRRGPSMSSLPSLSMEEMFFRPGYVSIDGIEPYIRGSIFRRCQETDLHVHDSMRNFLFTNVEEEIGHDIVATNLQRSRDHALPSYNTIREKFKMKRARTFSDITTNRAVQSKLSTAYGGSVDDVEPWIGLMAEDHMSRSSMGPTLFRIWKKEFTRLRNGDRFFYKVPNLFSSQLFNDFSRLKRIYKERDTMAQIILRNSDVTPDEIGSSVWFAQS